MTELDQALARYGLPPEAARFLPTDGPDLAERAADLAELLRQMRGTVTTPAGLGRN